MTPVTTEPATPTGTVSSKAAQPVPLVGGKATLPVPNATAPVKVLYSGDALYNASTATTTYSATSATGGVGGTVPATLSLTLGPAATFGPLVPGVPNVYTATTSANVISSAGDAALTVSDPGHLANGAFTLPQPLPGLDRAERVERPGVQRDRRRSRSGRPIGATDALRTGTYSRTLTFTLATTNP